MLRDWEAREDYKDAVEKTDLLLLWSSMEAVVRRTGGDTAFTISRAQKSLANRSMIEGESIPSFVAAARVLVEGLEEAGGELNYPECIATCINNVDATRFHNWVYDKIREREADTKITLNELLNDLAAWEAFRQHTE